jgi:hypothetical protein
MALLKEGFSLAREMTHKSEVPLSRPRISSAAAVCPLEKGNQPSAVYVRRAA